MSNTAGTVRKKIRYRPRVSSHLFGELARLVRVGNQPFDSSLTISCSRDLAEAFLTTACLFDEVSPGVAKLFSVAEAVIEANDQMDALAVEHAAEIGSLHHHRLVISVTHDEGSSTIINRYDFWIEISHNKPRLVFLGDAR